ARRGDDLLDRGPLLSPEYRCDVAANIGDVDVHAVQRNARDGVALAKQSEEDVLRPDVAVMRALGLLLRQRQHPLARLGEALERIHACTTSSRIVDAGPPVWLGLPRFDGHV